MGGSGRVGDEMRNGKQEGGWGYRGWDMMYSLKKFELHDPRLG